MWHRPQLMNAIADLLIVAAAAAFIVAAMLWIAHLPLFPLKEVVVTHELKEVKRDDVAKVVAKRLKGNFFSVDVDDLRKGLEEISWVRRANVQRQWPGKLVVSMEEHQPVAFWGAASGQLVNSHGEIFSGTLSKAPAEPMPVLNGPTDFVTDMLDFYRQAQEQLKPIGREARAVNVSPRLAVELRLDDGMLVELGREQIKLPLKTRLSRFIENYQSIVTVAGARPDRVDMRYPNGFALRVAALQRTAIKGKP